MVLESLHLKKHFKYLWRYLTEENQRFLLELSKRVIRIIIDQKIKCSSNNQIKEYIPPKDPFFPGPGTSEIRGFIERYKKNDSLENLRKNNKLILYNDSNTKRRSVPNNPVPVLLELSPKNNEEDSFSSKMLETDNHFKREIIPPRRVEDAVRIHNSKTYKTVKLVSSNINLKVEGRPESRSRKNQSPMKIDILPKDLFNQSNIHTRAPSRASSQDYSPILDKKFDKFLIRNKTLGQYGNNITPQRRRKKSIDKSLAVLSSEMLGKLSQRYNTNKERPKNVIVIKNFNQHLDYFKNFALPSPDKRKDNI